MNKIKNNMKGFVFLLEATLSLIIFSLVLFSFSNNYTNYSLKELIIIQQTNDLLRVWSAKETTTQEMINDTKLLFNEKATLRINNIVVFETKRETNCYTTSGEILTSNLDSKFIEITACE